MTSQRGADADIEAILSPIMRLVGPRQHLRVVRVGHNLTVTNEARGLFVRVHAPGLPPGRIEREPTICRYLRSAGLRVPVPADLNVSQPIDLGGGRQCTVWCLEHGRSGTVDDYERLGRQLRALHGVPIPSKAIGWDWSPRPRLDRWIDELEQLDPAWLPPGSLSGLRHRIVDCLDRVEGHGSADDLVFCHGDAHPGNLLCSDDGDLLVDFEYAGVGPREWDLSEIRCHRRRFGLTGPARRAFALGYGPDARVQNASAEEFLILRELMLACWAVYRTATIGGDRRQALVRLSSAGDGNSSTRWQPL